MRVLIGPDGGVREVRARGSSGIRELNEQLIGFARQATYIPATLDGVPVTVWMLNERIEVVP